MLSYHASGVPHAMHAEPGLTSERRSGMRAATTFRKLPNARPGRSAMVAKASPSQMAWLFRRTMLSISTKRWFVFAGVMSTASDTDSVARGGRALDAL